MPGNGAGIRPAPRNLPYHLQTATPWPAFPLVRRGPIVTVNVRRRVQPSAAIVTRYVTQAAELAAKIRRYTDARAGVGGEAAKLQVVASAEAAGVDCHDRAVSEAER